MGESGGPPHVGGVLAGPRPTVYDPAAHHQYKGTGGGPRATPTAFARKAVPASAAPSPPPATTDIMGDRVPAPLASTHFRTAMALPHSHGGCPSTGGIHGIEVCLLDCLLIFRRL